LATFNTTESNMAQMNLITFSVPFFYTIFTRLKGNLFSFLYFILFEWVVAIFILFLVEHYTFIQSLRYYFLAYLAFISLYEIGYFVNDVFSVRYEKYPRHRLNNMNISSGMAILFVGVRLTVFAVITTVLDFWHEPRWTGFYIALVIIFSIHNLLRKKDLKPITFLGLASLRFFGPILSFISLETFHLLLPPFVLCYLVYRFLSYLDSKDLLKIPSRADVKWKVYYYGVVTILNGFLSLYLGSLIPFLISIYFLVLWSVVFVCFPSLNSKTTFRSV